MLSIKRILFPTDFSESANSALGWALLLAKNFEAQLDMFHAVVLHSDDVGEDVYSRFPDLDKCIQTLMDNADSRLEKTIEDSGKVSVRQKVRRGLSAVEEILRYADEEKVDLIVMGTHGRRGISHLLLGSVAERVVRAAPCPILTIRRKDEPSEKIDIRNILLPTDFSDFSKIAARYAIVMSKILGARLSVIHVIDSSVHPAFHTVGLGSPLKVDDELKSRVEGMIKDFMKECQATIDYDVIVEEGKPENRISKIADEMDESLVIISSHGEGFVERALLGSTTERVIKLTKSPVLTVKKDARDFVK